MLPVIDEEGFSFGRGGGSCWWFIFSFLHNGDEGCGLIDFADRCVGDDLSTARCTDVNDRCKGEQLLLKERKGR